MKLIKDALKKPEVGNRKVAVNGRTQLFLLAGLLVAGWMKMDFQLYLSYVVGVSGASFAFMWANTKTNAPVVPAEPESPKE